MKLISIIIPTYNRSQLLMLTLDSVRHQTYRDWECLVVDDFSTDDTQEKVTALTREDPRFHYLKNEQAKGAQGARNTGFAKAKGDFICFFDSDNIMYAPYLEKKLQAFFQKPHTDVVTSFSHILDENDKVTGTFCWLTEGNIHHDLLTGKSYVDTNSALIRRSAIKEVAPWDVTCPSYQELDFHLNLSKSSRYSFVPEFLTGYYRRSTDTISSDSPRELKGRFFIFTKYREAYRMALDTSTYLNKIFQLYSSCKTANINIHEHIVLTGDEKRYLMKQNFRILLSKFLKR